ncbi:MAG TPA: hypothetical protein VLL05_08795 [Terriglobales bacterium]|nr:hypothetical protein [Terriglobales bacterium]
MIESTSPLIDALAQGIQVKALMFRRVCREIPVGPLQQRPAANPVPPRIVMKGDRHLDQPLQKLAFRLRGRAPDILQDLVGFKEMGGVEEGQPFKERVAV